MELTLTSDAIKEMDTGLEIGDYNYSPDSATICMTLSKSLYFLGTEFPQGYRKETGLSNV